MGWATGSELAEDIWDLVREFIPKGKIKEVSNEFINLFENYDCDTMEECNQLMEDSGREDK